MEITEIEIGGSFEVGYGQWRKVSIRATISPTDNVDDCANKLGKKVDEILFPSGTSVTNQQEKIAESGDVKRRQSDKMPADKAIMKKYVSAVAAGDTKTIEKLKSQYDIKLAGDVTEKKHTESGQDTQ